jgi:hypothetical protein
VVSSVQVAKIEFLSQLGGKESVLWGILLTGGWEGLVHVVANFLSLMHFPAYQQLGIFCRHSDHVRKASTPAGWNTRKC